MIRQIHPAWRLAAAIVLLVTWVSAPVHAEVSIGSPGSVQGLLLAGPGGDDPHPVPWSVARRNLPPFQVLNPDGDDNGDGPAAFAIEPGTGTPWVAWARFDGDDHEIVVSRWTGTAWSVPETLTENATEDLDPALDFSPDGVLEVTWWRDGTTPRVLRRRRAPDGTWSGEEPVTDPASAARLPSVAAGGATLRVAWQGEDGPDTTIVVSSRRSDGTWQPELVARTSWSGPGGDGRVAVEVHSVGGRTWVDWVDGPGVLAFSVRDPETGTWSDRQTEPYDWNQAAGETEYHARELARQRVRWRVLAN